MSMSQPPQQQQQAAADQSVAEQKARQVAGAGMAVGKAGMDKGLKMVKEMDAGQIGMVIKVLNLVTGVVLVLLVGVLTAWTIFEFWFGICDDTKTFKDGGCGIPDANLELQGIPFGNTFSSFVISLYMVPLGLVLIVYELCTNRAGGAEGKIQAKLAPTKAKLQLYFGFIFFYKRRTQFLVFVGVLCLGNQIKYTDDGTVPEGAGMAGSGAFMGGILAIVNAIVHYVVRKQHPEFDKSVQDTISANDGLSDSAAGAPPAGAMSAPRGMERQAEDVQTPAWNSPAQPSFAPAPAPAPFAAAPAPQPSWGGDDGGTAI